MELNTLINNLRGFKNIMREKSVSVLDDKLNEIADLNRDRIVQGQTVVGSPIKFSRPRKGKTNGAYTNAYARTKAKQGGQTSVVDLKLEGAYVNQIAAKREGSTIITQSSVSIAQAKNGQDVLDKNYDNHIGLTQMQLSTYGEIAAIRISEIAVKTILSK